MPVVSAARIFRFAPCRSALSTEIGPASTPIPPLPASAAATFVAPPVVFTTVTEMPSFLKKPSAIAT